MSAPRQTIRYPVNAVLQRGRRSPRASLSAAIANGLVCHTTAHEAKRPLNDDVFCGSMVTLPTYRTRRYRTSCSRLRRCLWNGRPSCMPNGLSGPETVWPVSAGRFHCRPGPVRIIPSSPHQKPLRSRHEEAWVYSATQQVGKQVRRLGIRGHICGDCAWVVQKRLQSQIARAGVEMAVCLDSEGNSIRLHQLKPK